MIRSFADRDTELLFLNRSVPRFKNIERVAWRKLHLIHSAVSIDDLRVLPGNRLEILQGNRSGQHSIRINNQWRVCFRWDGVNAHDVEIVDYH